YRRFRPWASRPSSSLWLWWVTCWRDGTRWGPKEESAGLRARVGEKGGLLAAFFFKPKERGRCGRASPGAAPVLRSAFPRPRPPRRKPEAPRGLPPRSGPPFHGPPATRG